MLFALLCNMRLLWPLGLWFLLLLPCLVGAYMVLVLRRHAALHYPNLGLVRDAMGRANRLRRHVPPLIFLAGIALCLITLSRPTTTVTTPARERTIILAIDVSRSMGERDVEPSRLAAAQAAAKTFITSQSDVRVGIVAFATYGQLVQAPTSDRARAIAAVERLQLQDHTAIGSGLIAALRMIFPADRLAERWDIYDEGELTLADVLRLDRDRVQPAVIEPGTMRPGQYPFAAIVLLTDGSETIGPSSEQAARFAAERGVRVYTVGFGKANTTRVENGRVVDLGLDERTLKRVAEITRGEYFPAASGAELRDVYRKLPGRIVLRKTGMELSALFAAVAALLVVVAGALSLTWCGPIGMDAKR